MGMEYLISVRGSHLNCDNGTCDRLDKYMSLSYSGSSHVICITRIYDIAWKAVSCP